MSVVWYDNAFESDPEEPDWHDIERIYCFDWHAFTDEHWQSLSTIYSLLPEYCGRDPADCAWWFSEVDDPKNGYLTASAEPPGLQVFGTLRIKDWERWDREFQSRIGKLPFRTLSGD